MLKTLLKNIFMAITLLPLVATSENKNTYLPPVFLDKDRLSKIQALIPEIDKIYKTYAEEKSYFL